MSLLERITLRWKQFRNERLYRRVQTDLPVTIFVDEDSHPRVERIADWSPGGIFVSTGNVLPLKTLLRLEFPMGEESSSMLRLQGQVVRHYKSESSGDGSGMGIMFTDLSETGLSLLRDLLTKAYDA